MSANQELDFSPKSPLIPSDEEEEDDEKEKQVAPKRLDQEQAGEQKKDDPSAQDRPNPAPGADQDQNRPNQLPPVVVAGRVRDRGRDSVRDDKGRSSFRGGRGSAVSDSSLQRRHRGVRGRSLADENTAEIVNLLMERGLLSGTFWDIPSSKALLGPTLEFIQASRVAEAKALDNFHRSMEEKYLLRYFGVTPAPFQAAVILDVAISKLRLPGWEDTMAASAVDLLRLASAYVTLSFFRVAAALDRPISAEKSLGRHSEKLFRQPFSELGKPLRKLILLVRHLLAPEATGNQTQIDQAVITSIEEVFEGRWGHVNHELQEFLNCLASELERSPLLVESKVLRRLLAEDPVAIALADTRRLTALLDAEALKVFNAYECWLNRKGGGPRRCSSTGDCTACDLADNIINWGTELQLHSPNRHGLTHRPTSPTFRAEGVRPVLQTSGQFKSASLGIGCQVETKIPCQSIPLAESKTEELQQLPFSLSGASTLSAQEVPIALLMTFPWISKLKEDFAFTCGCRSSCSRLLIEADKLRSQCPTLDDFKRKFPQAREWKCSEALVLSSYDAEFRVGKCRGGRHELIGRLRGGMNTPANPSANPSASPSSLALAAGLASVGTRLDNLEKLADKVKALELENARLAKEAVEAEKKLKEVQTKLEGKDPSASSVLVLGTDGTLFPKSDLSKTTVNDLGKNIKKNFSKGDNLSILLQYYIIAKGMRNVSVSVAWERLFHLLNSLNPVDQSGLLKMRTLYQTVGITTIEVLPWKDVMSSFMQKVEPTIEVTLLTARLSKIEFVEAAAYRVKFEEGLLLLEMMGVERPSKMELARVVLTAIQTEDRKAAAEMSDEVARQKGTTVDLQSLEYTEILSLMEKVELARALRRTLDISLGRKHEATTPRDRAPADQEGSNRNRRKRGKRPRSGDRGARDGQTGDGKGNPAPTPATPKPAPTPSKKKCDLCAGVHARKDCWISTASSPPECRKCHKTGHLAKACRASVPVKKESQGKKGKDPKHPKKRKKRESSSSDSESSHLVAVEADPSDLTLFNDLSARIEEFAEVVLNPKVKKPEVTAEFCKLASHHVTLDTGTSIDLVDEATVLQLRRLHEEKGNVSRKDFLPCNVGVRAAGGSRLTVLGKQWLTLDLGQGIVFGSVFVVVRGLGVPALLGNYTMLRVGMTIVLRLPDPHILVASKGADVRFPIELETANMISSYLLTYNSSVVKAIERAEAPATLTNPPDFGKGGGRKKEATTSQQ